ncbi:MAG: hypothetical protein Q8O76_05575, partial [Chloroflexota bacterium]|nr:hypothetical protein [Chloroflexota bacterium]
PLPGGGLRTCRHADTHAETNAHSDGRCSGAHAYPYHSARGGAKRHSYRGGARRGDAAFH